jgi:hypothetical protein
MISEVRIVKELWAHFLQVRILKGLCRFGTWGRLLAAPAERFER